MERYPEICVDSTRYRVVRDDGSQVVRAVNGDPWIYRGEYDRVQITYEVVHKALAWEAEAALHAFYDANRTAAVIFVDPRSKAETAVFMARPFELVGMDSDSRGSLSMLLVATNE